MLNIDQSPAELEDIHGSKDYYWYLRSPEFIETFLKPIADIVNELGQPCLDVGCGEGVLSRLVKVPYAGFDGSEQAIMKGEKANPNANLHVGRMENPPLLFSHFPTIVFGGILEVLIKPEARIRFLEMYRKRYKATYFVIYDLERLDTTTIYLAYGYPLKELHLSCPSMPGLLEVKRHRKILLYNCSSPTL